MKAAGTRASERLSRKRQRLEEDKKRVASSGDHSPTGSTDTFRPKIGGRHHELDCGILPSE